MSTDIQDIICTLETANLRKPQLDKLKRVLGHLVREREWELRDIAARKRRPTGERDLERKLGLQLINIGYQKLQGMPGADRVRAALRRLA